MRDKWQNRDVKNQEYQEKMRAFEEAKERREEESMGWQEESKEREREQRRAAGPRMRGSMTEEVLRGC